MICPSCHHYMREYINSYRCIYCGKSLSKCKFNVSPKPADLHPRIRRKPFNITGLFWLFYFMALVLGFAVFLLWLHKPYYTIFLGGI